MLLWTGAVFFRKLPCSTADVLWYRTRSITPLCLRNNWGLDQFFFWVGRLIAWTDVCMCLAKMSVSETNIVQVQVYKGKLQFFQTTHPTQDSSGITVIYDHSSHQESIFKKKKNWGWGLTMKALWWLFKTIFVQRNTPFLWETENSFCIQKQQKYLRASCSGKAFLLSSAVISSVDAARQVWVAKREILLHYFSPFPFLFVLPSCVPHK